MVGSTVEHHVSIHLDYTFKILNFQTYFKPFGVEILEVCICGANSPVVVVGKFDSLVATESGRRASSYGLGPGGCARRDDRVQDAGGTDSSGFGDDRVDGDGSDDCGGWHWETEARASLGDVWRRELGNAVGNGREVVALNRCWEGPGCAKAAG